MRLALRCTYAEGSFPSRGGILRRCSSLPSFPWACDCNLNYQEAFLPLRKESIGSGVPGGKWRCGERKGKSAVKLNQNCLGGDRVCARHGVLHYSEKKVSSQTAVSSISDSPPKHRNAHRRFKFEATVFSRYSTYNSPSLDGDVPLGPAQGITDSKPVKSGGHSSLLPPFPLFPCVVCVYSAWSVRM